MRSHGFVPTVLQFLRTLGNLRVAAVLAEKQRISLTNNDIHASAVDLLGEAMQHRGGQAGEGDRVRADPCSAAQSARGVLWSAGKIEQCLQQLGVAVRL